ncbi:ATP-binding protein [Paenibacillus terrigena]|uniref:sensor histidine kinase n=1 Tax=Paenibacillus terrigena TaxID=369333 RepID=UPI0028D585DC|nr:ATP-binding protein [Paenibacillus terrigena]
MGKYGILRRTQFMLFFTLMMTSILLMVIAGLFLSLTWNESLTAYKKQVIRDQTHKMAFTLRSNLEPGILSKEQTEWMRKAVNIYAMHVRYYGPDHQSVLFDSVPKSHKWAVPYTVSVPISVNGVLLGYLDTFVDLNNVQHIPYLAFLANNLVHQNKESVFFVILISILVSYGAARWLSRSLRTSGKMAELITSGDRDIVIPTVGMKELDQLTHAINTLSADFTKQETWRKQSMQDLTHELRTPLTSMLSRMEALIDGIYPVNEENLNRIYAEIDRLCRLVDEVEKLSEAEGARFQLVMQQVDLRELVKDVYENMIFLVKDKGITFHLHHLHVPCPIRVDADRLIQVITNVISNAIKYTPTGGTIEVGLLVKDASTVTMYCTDSGIGISEQDLPLIFNRFYRADKARSRGTGGIGVGLSIAKALIEAHGGTIDADSELGEGSTFWLHLPLAKSIH